MLFIFFFQAEDGIRDVAVTGVQTCALPISSRSRLIVRPIASGVVSRLRRRRLPSEASSAASSSPQIWLGRAFTLRHLAGVGGGRGGSWRVVEVASSRPPPSSTTSTILHHPRCEPPARTPVVPACGTPARAPPRPA